MDLFAPHPSDNLLPFDGIVNDYGMVLHNDRDLYQQLLKQLPWQSDKVTLFGKTHITTRKIVWMGNSDNKDLLAYTYSGHTRSIQPWHEAVFHVKQLIEKKLYENKVNVDFNSCLLNYYPSGDEGLGYHADDEPELGPQPIIASLSLGATRKFVLKHKNVQQKVELHLESGQLIIMRGDTQQYWKHTVTKTKTVQEGRISLTFRQMITSNHCFE